MYGFWHVFGLCFEPCFKVESEKTEPVILENASENISEIQEEEKLEKTDLNDESEPEFNAKDEDLEDDFNQETEEELLDIPTFLRRQAN